MTSPDAEADALLRWAKNGSKPDPQSWRDVRTERIPDLFRGSLNIALMRLFCAAIGASGKERDSAVEVLEMFFGDQGPKASPTRHSGLCIREQNAPGYGPMTLGGAYMLSQAGILKEETIQWLRDVTSPMGLVCLPKRPKPPEGKADFLRTGPFVAIPGSRMASRILGELQSENSLWFAMVAGIPFDFRAPNHPTTGVQMLQACLARGGVDLGAEYRAVLSANLRNPAGLRTLLSRSRYMAPVTVIYFEDGSFISFQSKNTFGTNPPVWGYIHEPGLEVQGLFVPNYKKVSNGVSAGACNFDPDGPGILATVRWQNRDHEGSIRVVNRSSIREIVTIGQDGIHGTGKPATDPDVAGSPKPKPPLPANPLLLIADELEEQARRLREIAGAG